MHDLLAILCGMAACIHGCQDKHRRILKESKVKEFKINIRLMFDVSCFNLKVKVKCISRYSQVPCEVTRQDG